MAWQLQSSRSWITLLHVIQLMKSPSGHAHDHNERKDKVDMEHLFADTMAEHHHELGFVISIQ